MSFRLFKMASRATLKARKAELAREEEKRKEEAARQSRLHELVLAKSEEILPKVGTAIRTAAEEGLDEVVISVAEYEDKPKEEDKMLVKSLIAFLVGRGLKAREQIVTYPRSASDEMPERNFLNVHISWQKK